MKPMTYMTPAAFPVRGATVPTVSLAATTGIDATGHAVGTRAFGPRDGVARSYLLSDVARSYLLSDVARTSPGRAPV